ncbi:PAS domain S-box protein [Chitinophaga lutea]|uniref:histidine kinase n=1 Tax=Chitinophaga lutea TaxID=2488634 RepID=A0A3N4PJL2_9BACT|nr:PAS domain S-box protein [Chitinophaga lutea]RPE08416.1 PAS domain S-box protein [Chitinophaga lutea]
MPEQFPIDTNATPEDISRSIKAIRESITDSDSLYQQLVKTLPAAIYFCDADGVITFYNSAAARLWGREPVIGVDRWCGSWKIFHTDGTPMPLEECPMAVTLRDRKAVSGAEIIVEKPDGTRRFVKPFPQPTFDGKGHFNGATNLLIDVTDHKNAEEQSAYLAAIVNSSDDAIISKTLDGIVISWNTSAERIFGYTAAEMIGQHITRIIPPDRHNEEPNILAQLKQGKRVDHFETKRLTKYGELRDISVTISPIFNSAGKIIGASKIARDVTIQREAEKIIRERDDQFRYMLEEILQERTHELVQLNKRLEKSNHDLEQFAYIASHDLQEPLRKILTFSEMIQDNPNGMSGEQLRYLGKVRTSALQMTSLIKDVLHYSRLSSLHEEHVPVELDGLFREVLSEFDLMTEQKKAKVHHDALPTIHGIPAQMKQLFRNLLSNSLKFCEGPPVINVQAHTNNGQALIQFRDNGIGFEQVYADKIFHIFNRLNNRGKYNGTGVGLALCKKIVENHNGSIRAESTPGLGTTFYIQLPLPA